MHHVHHTKNLLDSFVLVDNVLDDLVDAILAHLPVQELDLDLQGRRLRLFGVSLHEELEAELDVAMAKKAPPPAGVGRHLGLDHGGGLRLHEEEVWEGGVGELRHYENEDGGPKRIGRYS